MGFSQVCMGVLEITQFPSHSLKTVTFGWHVAIIINFNANLCGDTS